MKFFTKKVPQQRFQRDEWLHITCVPGVSFYPVLVCQSVRRASPILKTLIVHEFLPFQANASDLVVVVQFRLNLVMLWNATGG